MSELTCMIINNTPNVICRGTDTLTHLHTHILLIFRDKFPLFITHDECFVQCGGSGGGSTMFLICPATNLLVDKNSVKYSLSTKIVPQEGYGTRVLTSDGL